MVRITQAILVAEYLRLLGRIGTDAMPTNGTQVFPSLSSEIKMPKKQELESLEQEICQSRLFTEDGFVVLLKEAVGVRLTLPRRRPFVLFIGLTCLFSN